MSTPPILQEENPLLDDEVMQPLVAVFLEQLPPRVKKMDAALQCADWATLTRYAHQIKGTAGSFGYPALTDQAGILEKTLKSGDTKCAASLFKEIKHYVLGAD